MLRIVALVNGARRRTSSALARWRRPMNSRGLTRLEWQGIDPSRSFFFWLFHTCVLPFTWLLCRRRGHHLRQQDHRQRPVLDETWLECTCCGSWFIASYTEWTKQEPLIAAMLEVL